MQPKLSLLDKNRAKVTNLPGGIPPVYDDPLNKRNVTGDTGERNRSHWHRVGRKRADKTAQFGYCAVSPLWKRMTIGTPGRNFNNHRQVTMMSIPRPWHYISGWRSMGRIRLPVRLRRTMPKIMQARLNFAITLVITCFCLLPIC